MTISNILQLLQEDLRREVTHMIFYLHASSMVIGPYRQYLADFFAESAREEFGHVKEFSDMLSGFHIDKLDLTPFEFLKSTNPEELLYYAVKLEEEVVKNYEQRIFQAEQIGGVDAKWIVVFLENQLEDSRKDLDKLNRMIRK